MNEASLAAWRSELLDRCERPAALLLGREPEEELGYRYVRHGPHEAVVIGSLEIGELLYFRSEPVFRALLAGKPVYLVESGLAHRQFGPGGNRVLWSRLQGAERSLRQMGVRFVARGTVSGPERAASQLITAQIARQLVRRGQSLPPGSRATPLARQILEGKG